MYNSQSLSTNNLSRDSWDIQHSREKRKETLSSEKILGLCEEYLKETQDSLDIIIDDKLAKWKQSLENHKKLIKEGKDFQDILQINSPTVWHDKMNSSFANHHAQNPSTSQLDHEAFHLYHKALDNRASQFRVETPSSASNLDGARDYLDMPVRKLNFDPVPFATRLV